MVNLILKIKEIKLREEHYNSIQFVCQLMNDDGAIIGEVRGLKGIYCWHHKK